MRGYSPYVYRRQVELPTACRFNNDPRSSYWRTVGRDVEGRHQRFHTHA